MATTYTSPTGHNDPSADWNNEANAYDTVLGTVADTLVLAAGWSSFIELTIAVQYFNTMIYYTSGSAFGEMSAIDIDVYDDTPQWVHVYNGVHVEDAWDKHDFTIAQLTKLRIRFYVDDVDAPYLNEVYFGLDYDEQSCSGSMTMSGWLGLHTFITKTGSMTMAGALGLLTQIAMAGSITMTGALAPVLRFLQAAAGSFTPTGVLGLLTKLQPSGSLTPTGALGLKTLIAIAGSFTPTGALATIFRQFLSAAGSFTPTGALGLKIKKTVSGSMTVAGTLSRNIFITLSGSMTAAGALVKKFFAWEGRLPH